MKKLSPLSETTQAIIYGSVLGDGSLKIHQPYINARFSFRHSIIQKEYFLWKVNQLSQISSDKAVWQQGTDSKPDGWGTIKFRYQSQALPQLTEMYNLIHPHKKFQIRRKWLNRMTPLSLAIWWQDDGSIIANGRKGVLCTDGFKPEEVKLLQQYLFKVWKIQTTASPVTKTKPDRMRLWFRSTEQLQNFLRIILPYIKVESMLSKCILLYHDLQLQQRWISEIAELTNFPTSAIDKAYQAKKGKWKTYASKISENDIVQS